MRVCDQVCENKAIFGRRLGIRCHCYKSFEQLVFLINATFHFDSHNNIKPDQKAKPKRVELELSELTKLTKIIPVKQKFDLASNLRRNLFEQETWS